MSLKRHTPLKSRRSPLRGSGTPIKAKPRSAAEFARVYGSAERATWMVQQRCAFCGRWPTEDVPNQQMHVEGGGMARKADADTTVPACHGCHDDAHHGIETFCRRRGLTRDTLRAMAGDYEAQWRAR